MPDAVSSSAAFSRLLDSVEKKGVDAHIAAPGDTYSVGDLQIEILSPLEESYENTNDYSAVVHAPLRRCEPFVYGRWPKQAGGESSS